VNAVALPGGNIYLYDGLIKLTNGNLNQLAAIIGRPGGDNTPFLFPGTLIVQGQGIAEVRATGPQTEMGKDSREDAKIAKEMNTEELSAIAVDAAFHIHKELGPGLLESVYE
jgi:magnesium-transporting ATPase (P-type)